MKWLGLFSSILFCLAAGCELKQGGQPAPTPTVTTTPAGPSEENAMPAASETPATTTPAAPSEPPVESKPEPKPEGKPEAKPEPTAEKDAVAKPADDKGWVSLFDGNTLAGWKSTEFGGEGDVKVEDGAIVMEIGQDMSGITWARKEPPPKSNYEIELEAQRVDGSDFFCGLTFPVNDSFCSFIVGGWGGGVVGLSSINGFDASENDTTQYMEFKTGRWYKIRVRVTPDHIQTWIDDKRVVDQDIKDRKVGIRGEVDLSKPLGVATWNTKGALRNIRLKKLDAETAGDAEKKAD